MGQIQKTGADSKTRPGTHSTQLCQPGLQSEVDKLLGAAISTNTAAVYRTGKTAFDNFRSKTELPLTWPPPVDHIVNFIAYLSIEGFSDATARSYIAAISYYCKLHHNEDPTHRFIVSKLLEGMKRLRHKPDHRLPVTSSLLGQIMSHLGVVCSTTYEAIMFAAAYSVAFFAFLRVGEITTNRTSRAVLDINDIKVTTETVSLHLRQSKTDQLKRGVVVLLNAIGGTTCPVSSMLAYLQIRPKLPGPAFCHYDGLPLSRTQFAAVLKNITTILGLHSKHYTTHSFRIGAATAASAVGISDDDIKTSGRWKSGAFKTYIRSPLTLRSNSSS